MNAEIHNIVSELERRTKKDSINEIDKQSYFMSQTSKLSVLLAKEEELRSKEVSKQTEIMIKLTKAIYFLTAVMVGLGIIQILVAIK